MVRADHCYRMGRPALIHLRHCAGRRGVIRFQHQRKIRFILIRNTVAPIATRTTPGSCLVNEGRQITEQSEPL
jgi:hypothetical protein